MEFDITLIVSREWYPFSLKNEKVRKKSISRCDSNSVSRKGKICEQELGFNNFYKEFWKCSFSNYC